MTLRLAIVAILALVGLVYQNCGEIKITTPKKDTSILPSGSHPVTLDLCIPQQAGVAYNIFATPLIINLNALPYQGSYKPDSDSDGLPDDDDGSPFNLTNSHTQNILDYVCYKAGVCSSTCSATSYYQLGVTRCDIQSYTNVSGGYDIFDSNFDGIPDFIQIIRHGDPFRAPTTDLDNDSRTLAEEIRDQTDPEWNDITTDVKKYRPTMKVLPNDTNCAFPAKHYLISAPNQPFAPVKSYTEAFNLTIGGQNYNLSHQVNENVIGVFVITYSASVPTTYNGYFYLGRIQDGLYSPGVTDTSINIKTSDLVKVGAWQ